MDATQNAAPAKPGTGLGAGLGAGLGLKPQHYDAACALHSSRTSGLWFEVHPENYLVEGGPRLAWLEAVRERHPLSLHGVLMSLAGPDEPDVQHLERLAALCERVQPALVSEHLAWSVLDGHYAPDLLPILRNRQALTRLERRIDQVQERLQRRIAIENPSHYLHLPGHEWEEADFLNTLARRSGCGLLLDVNNVCVSAHNLGFDPWPLLCAFDPDAVLEIHLAGHQADPLIGEALWVDAHATPVSEGVWRLYQRLIERIGPRPTLIERDGDVPTFDELLQERERAQRGLQAAGWQPAQAAGLPGMAWAAAARGSQAFPLGATDAAA